MREKLVGAPKGRAAPLVHDGLDVLACSTYDLILLKPRDLLPLLRQGILDLAVVPDEWVIEDELAHLDGLVVAEVFAARSVVDLAWLMGPGRYADLRAGVCAASFVVTSFPASARYFMEVLGLVMPIVLTTGSVEAITSSCDAAGFDVVETGDTARRHGLDVHPVATTRGLMLASLRGCSPKRYEVDAIASELGAVKGDGRQSAA